MRKTVYFQYSKFQNGHNPHNNWWKLTMYYAKFQLNMSKHVIEKCGKLCIFSILSSKRGITPTRIDGNWWQSNLICSTVKKKSYAKYSARYVKACKRKVRKTVYFQHSKFQKGHNSYKNWRHSNLICSTLKQSQMQNFSSICLSV